MEEANNSWLDTLTCLRAFLLFLSFSSYYGICSGTVVILKRHSSSKRVKEKNCGQLFSFDEILSRCRNSCPLLLY